MEISLPPIVISSAEQYEAALQVIAAWQDAPPDSKEAYLRDALQAAVDEWWNARRRRQN